MYHYDDYGISKAAERIKKQQLDRKYKKHRKEIKKFLSNLTYIEFQELLEIWAKHESKKKDIAISATSDIFYKSIEWKRLRYLKLKESDGRCEECGKNKSNGIVLHVDHIKSRWLFPELAWKIHNLRVLCGECNEGKGITGRIDSKSRPHILRKAIDRNVSIERQVFNQRKINQTQIKRIGEIDYNAKKNKIHIQV